MPEEATPLPELRNPIYTRHGDIAVEIKKKKGAKWTPMTLISDKATRDPANDPLLALARSMGPAPYIPEMRGQPRYRRNGDIAVELRHLDETEWNEVTLRNGPGAAFQAALAMDPAPYIPEMRDPEFDAFGNIEVQVRHEGETGFHPLGILKDSEKRADWFAAALAMGPAPYEAPPRPDATADDVRAEAARRLAALASGYSREERETWTVQVDEARALQADASAPTPMLSALASGRGVSVADMAAIVLSKSASLAAASGAVLAAQAALLAQDPIPPDFDAEAHWPQFPS